MKEKTHQMIEKIYDTILHPESWNILLDEFVSRYDLKACNLFCSDACNEELNVGWASSTVRENFGAFVEKGFIDMELGFYPYVPKVVTESKFTSDQVIEKLIEVNFSYTDPGLAHLREWLSCR